MTHAKLESQDEAVWRPALEELASAKAPVLADPKERTPDYGIRQVCKVAEGASYRVEVRKAAIELIGKRKDYDRLLSLYDTAVKQKWNDELTKAVVAALALDTEDGFGRIALMSVGFHDRQNRRIDGEAVIACHGAAEMLLANTSNGQERALSVICMYMMDHPTYEAISKPKVNGKYYEPRKDDLATFCYFGIKNPTVALSKRILSWPGLNEGKQIAEVVERIPEKDLRELLPSLRDRNPDKYWKAWSLCATNDEALKIWNSKASEEKRLMAIGRVRDEKVLVDAIEQMRPQTKENRFARDAVVLALGSLANVEKLAAYAKDETLDNSLRVAAFKSLAKCVCANATGKEISLLTDALKSLDYTEGFGAMFEFAQDEARKRDCKAVEQAVRKAVEGRVNDIIRDGKSVEEEVICTSGIRPGMYAWECDLLRAYQLPSVSGIFRSAANFDGSVKFIAYKGAAIKEVCGDVNVPSAAAVKDALSTKYGDGLKFCEYRVEREDDGQVVVYCIAKPGIPRYKGRNPNKKEKELLQAEMIRKDGEIKGYIGKFFSGKSKPQKGLVYGTYNPWNGDNGENGEVMAVFKEGIVIGRKPIVEKTETRTLEDKNRNFLDDPKWVETVKVKTDVTEFPAKLFIKAKGNFSVGQECPKGKYRCIGEIKVGNDVMNAFEVYSLPKK